ncbi:TPA: hypothetical protein ACXJNB_004343 [Serratia marcescens]
MKKNYAGMAEVTSRDCIMIGLSASSHKQIVYLGDFNGGTAKLTYGQNGNTISLEIHGASEDNEIQLKSDGKVIYSLYGEKDQTPKFDQQGFKYYVAAPLKKGQMLSLVTHPNTYQSTELRLNILDI